MKAKELTGKILLANGFKEYENEVMKDGRLFLYYNYLEGRWSVWLLGPDGKRDRHLGFCRTVEKMNELLRKNNIAKEIK
jgi:hypothetical protein